MPLRLTHVQGPALDPLVALRIQLVNPDEHYPSYLESLKLCNLQLHLNVSLKHHPVL